jgi:hypothetical protein
MSNIVAAIAALTALGKTPESIAKKIRKDMPLLTLNAGERSRRFAAGKTLGNKKDDEPWHAVDSSASGMHSSDSKSVDDDGSTVESSDDAIDSSEEDSDSREKDKKEKKAAKKKKAKKAKAERMAARVALAAAALTRARVTRRIVANDERADIFTKLGIAPAEAERNAARLRLDEIKDDADASAVRFFARRGVSEHDARKMAKSAMLDLVGFRHLIERGEGEALQRKAG